jgi:hypothetical protein
VSPGQPSSTTGKMGDLGEKRGSMQPGVLPGAMLTAGAPRWAMSDWRTGALFSGGLGPYAAAGNALLSVHTIRSLPSVPQGLRALLGGLFVASAIGVPMVEQRRLNAPLGRGAFPHRFSRGAAISPLTVIETPALTNLPVRRTRRLCMART